MFKTLEKEIHRFPHTELETGTGCSPGLRFFSSFFGFSSGNQDVKDASNIISICSFSRVCIFSSSDLVGENGSQCVFPSACLVEACCVASICRAGRK